MRQSVPEVDIRVMLDTMQHIVKIAAYSILGLILTVALSSCSSPPPTVSFNTIEAEHARAIYKLTPGMPKQQVQKLFPTARSVYQKSSAEGDFEILEVQHTLLSVPASSNIYERLWFCMHDGRLEDWGEMDTFYDHEKWHSNDNLCPCQADKGMVGEDGKR